MVASYLIVTLLPTFSTTGRLKEIVSPENGITGFGADAIEFAADGALARPRGPRPSISAGVGRSGRAPPDSITDSEPLLMRGLMPRSTGASLLRRKFKFAAKAATGCRTSCLSHANVVGAALLPLPGNVLLLSSVCSEPSPPSGDAIGVTTAQVAPVVTYAVVVEELTVDRKSVV